MKCQEGSDGQYRQQAPKKMAQTNLVVHLVREEGAQLVLFQERSLLLIGLLSRHRNLLLPQLVQLLPLQVLPLAHLPVLLRLLIKRIPSKPWISKKKTLWIWTRAWKVRVFQGGRHCALGL